MLRIRSSKCLGFGLLFLGCQFDPVVQGNPVSACDCAPLDAYLAAGETSKTENASNLIVNCLQASTSEVEFMYRVEAGAWATCSVSTGFDLSDFDGDFGNSGLLEVRFCVETQYEPAGSPLPPGSLNLWYGEHPWRRQLPLLDPKNPFRGCTTKYFSAADARFADWEDVGSCRGLCGKSGCSNNQLEVGAAPLMLTVEGDDFGTRALDVRLLSVRHWPHSCICESNRECRIPAKNRCNAEVIKSSPSLSAPICPPDPVVRGTCVSSAWSSCSDTVGRSVSGPSSATESFRKAFVLHSPRIGCPGSPTSGSDPYVHVLSSILIQDYYQPDVSKSYSVDDGWTALVYNSKLDRASLLSGVIWAIYKCVNTGGTSVGGPDVLGAPIDDQIWDGTSIRQEFDRGTVIWTPGAGSEAGVATVNLIEAAPGAQVSANCNLRVSFVQP